MSKIAGPGGPHERDGVVVDTTGAVMLENIEVVVVGAIRDGHLDEIVLAMELEGRINKTKERSDVLYLFDVDGAAAIISELFAMAVWVGPEFLLLLEKRLAAMP